MKKLGLFALFLNLITLTAQQYQAVSLASGFIIPHHDDMYHLYRHQYSLSYQSSKFLKEQKDQMGYHCYVADLGSKTLGWAAAVGAEFDKRFVTSQKWAISGAFTAGIGWVSNPYDSKNNPRNRAIGSYLNGYVRVGVKSRYILNQSTFVSAELQLSHFSNAAWTAPNLGVNIPSIGLSVGRILQKSNIQPIKWQKENKWTPFVSFRVGRKSLDIDDSRWFMHYTSELGLDYKLSETSSLRGAILVQSDPFYRFEKFQDLAPLASNNVVEVGLSVGYKAYWGKWNTFFDVGYYLYKPDKGYKTPYFEALGLGYRINEKWEPVLRLKANKTTADVMEWGVIYYLN